MRDGEEKRCSKEPSPVKSRYREQKIVIEAMKLPRKRGTRKLNADVGYNNKKSDCGLCEETAVAVEHV